MKVKSLWRGAFNFHQTAKVMYTYAYSERQAWAVFCQRLAKKDGVHPSAVYRIFDGSRDNYEIKIELEVRENE
jgi:hypothetical protein